MNSLPPGDLVQTKPKRGSGGGRYPGAGRKPLWRAMTTIKFRELVQKHGPRALEIIHEIAEDTNQPAIVRFTAAKWLAERGFGGVPINEGEGGQGPTVVRVITGVHGDGRDIPATPRPLLPDGRDPLAQAKPPPRPVGRAPVEEPLQHRLFEDDK